jgi:chorismate-pyruvate lyase
VNFRALTPFQRSLLVIDGTVTRFIEAYTMEPMEIRKLSQKSRSLEEDHPWLDAATGTPVIVREVAILGRYSRTFFAYAISVLVRDALPDDIRERLDMEGEGIGRLLREGELETRRQILWYGRERVDHLPESIRTLTDGEFVSRTYRIIGGGTPLALINEKFPTSVDRSPTHH